MGSRGQHNTENRASLDDWITRLEALTTTPKADHTTGQRPSNRATSSDGQHALLGPSAIVEQIFLRAVIDGE
jgi:hypothetical protein